MNTFLRFGNLIFNAAQVIWIDFAASDQNSQLAVEVKMANDDETWKLSGADRDAAFEWVARQKSAMSTFLRAGSAEPPRFAVFGTKAFNIVEIRWFNLDCKDETGGTALEVVTTDNTSWKLKDDDAVQASNWLNNWLNNMAHTAY